ncbi:MAG: lactate utilization protein C [Nitriliruptoraceae bacterium]
MSTRDRILARLHRALADRPAVPTIPREYRCAGEPEVTREERLALLVDRLEDYRAEVRSTDPAGLPETIAQALHGARRVVIPTELDRRWVPATLDVVPDHGLAAAELDRIDAVLTGARLAIAQTGTIVLDGGPDQGRRAITLVPDRHVCVVTADQVVYGLPDAITRLDPTRPQTWISGPSATSDIELDRVEGVHGPRQLTVILCS